MKKLKKIKLKSVVLLSPNEMKQLHGANSNPSDGQAGCYVKCDGVMFFSEGLSGCKLCLTGGNIIHCMAAPSGIDGPQEARSYGCSGNTLVLLNTSGSSLIP